MQLYNKFFILTNEFFQISKHIWTPPYIQLLIFFQDLTLTYTKYNPYNLFVSNKSSTKNISFLIQVNNFALLPLYKILFKY